MKRAAGCVLLVFLLSLVVVGMVAALTPYADELTALAGVVAVLEILVIFALISFRSLRNIRRREDVPLLQSRDWLLFFFFVVITVAQQWSRATGAHLADYPAWVIFTDLLELTV